MRCLFVADLHYSLPQFDWLLHAASGYDLVVLAGDALDVGSIVDFRAQTLVVTKYLQRIAGVTRLVVCSGNHDLDARGDDGEKYPRWIAELRGLGIGADGDTLEIDDALITVCAWWDGPLARERLLAQIAADAGRRQGRRWIWIHHAPPKNSPTSWSGSRTMGDGDVEQWIAQYEPDIVVAGHIHQSPFVREGSWADRIGKTWVFNAGHQFGAPPAQVALDTTAGEAVWVSAMGVQRVRLDAPLERPIPPATALPDWFPAG
ncbi:metallophosphoesterase family protein [Alsobacter sp. R-9]